MYHLILPYHRQKGVSKTFWTDIALMHSLIWKVQRKVVGNFKWFKGSQVVCNTWLLMESHLWNVRWHCWCYQHFSQYAELEDQHDWYREGNSSGQYAYFCLTGYCFTSSKGLTKQQRCMKICPKHFWESWWLCQLCRSSLDDCRARDGRTAHEFRLEDFHKEQSLVSKKGLCAGLAAWESTEVARQ